MCLMKMLHHVCLIPFCITDMILAKCFFKQLNNLLLSMLPQRVPDLDKKTPSLLSFFWDSHRPFASEPLHEETCNVLGTNMLLTPRSKNVIT